MTLVRVIERFEKLRVREITALVLEIYMY